MIQPHQFEVFGPDYIAHAINDGAAVIPDLLSNRSVRRLRRRLAPAVGMVAPHIEVVKQDAPEIVPVVEYILSPENVLRGMHVGTQSFVKAADRNKTGHTDGSSLTLILPWSGPEATFSADDRVFKYKDGLYDPVPATQVPYGQRAALLLRQDVFSVNGVELSLLAANHMGVADEARGLLFVDFHARGLDITLPGVVLDGVALDIPEVL